MTIFPVGKTPQLFTRDRLAAGAPRAQAAVGDLDAERFVRSLEEDAVRHRAVRHPLLQALAENRLPDEHATLVAFARSYAGYASYFPRYLTITISRLADPRHRAFLLENLQEESGEYEEAEIETLEAAGLDREWFDGVPHPELFERFSSTLGVSSTGRESVEAADGWREAFCRVLEGASPAQAVGALGLGTEGIVSSIYGPFSAAVRRHPKLSGRAGVFFSLHNLVDEQHQAAFHSIAVEMARQPASREDLRRGMNEALDLRASYWDWLQDRAPGRTRNCRAS